MQSTFIIKVKFSGFVFLMNLLQFDRKNFGPSKWAFKFFFLKILTDPVNFYLNFLWSSIAQSKIFKMEFIAFRNKTRQLSVNEYYKIVALRPNWNSISLQFSSFIFYITLLAWSNKISSKCIVKFIIRNELLGSEAENTFARRIVYAISNTHTTKVQQRRRVFQFSRSNVSRKMILQWENISQRK